MIIVITILFGLLQNYRRWRFPATPIWVDLLSSDEWAAAVVSSYCKITMTH